MTDVPLVEVYRDRWLLVVDKPAGLPSQAPRGGGENAFDHIRAAEVYAALHHRLDTPASGLLVFGLAKKANSGLARLFREHLAERCYLAVVLGDPGEAGTWETPIEGREAKTLWQRVSTGRGISLLQVRLVTGRTHQIRIHAQTAGHPILGDRRHGGAAGRAWPRLALHAWKMAFVHPVNGQHLALAAPIPPDLGPLVERAGGRRS